MAMLSSESSENFDSIYHSQVLSDMHNNDNNDNNGDFGLKRMGEIDHKTVFKSCRLRYSPAYADIKAAKLCSEWQEKLKNPQWHPIQNCHASR